MGIPWGEPFTLASHLFPDGKSSPTLHPQGVVSLTTSSCGWELSTVTPPPPPVLQPKDTIRNWDVKVLWFLDAKTKKLVSRFPGIFATFKRIPLKLFMYFIVMYYIYGFIIYVLGWSFKGRIENRSRKSMTQSRTEELWIDVTDSGWNVLLSWFWRKEVDLRVRNLKTSVVSLTDSTTSMYSTPLPYTLTVWLTVSDRTLILDSDCSSESIPLTSLFVLFTGIPTVISCSTVKPCSPL